MISELHTLVVSGRTFERALVSDDGRYRAKQKELKQRCPKSSSNASHRVSTTFRSEVIVVKPSSKAVNDIGEPREQAR
jgi:hypothetical protein